MAVEQMSIMHVILRTIRLLDHDVMFEKLFSVVALFCESNFVLVSLGGRQRL